jgi:hypothetical protein
MSGPKKLCPLSGDARIQGKEERGTDIDSLQKNILIYNVCILPVSPPRK